MTRDLWLTRLRLWRPSRIGRRLLAFNLLLVFLPVAGILYLDVYETRLLDVQERGMVQQGRLVAAALGDRDRILPMRRKRCCRDSVGAVTRGSVSTTRRACCWPTRCGRRTSVFPSSPLTRRPVVTPRRPAFANVFSTGSVRGWPACAGRWRRSHDPCWPGHAPPRATALPIRRRGRSFAPRSKGGMAPMCGRHRANVR